MTDIDPQEVLQGFLSSVDLPDHFREDVQATFEDFSELLLRSALGEDVSKELAQVRAQIALWKSGSYAAAYTAFWRAAKEYALKVGEGLLRTATTVL